MAKKLTFIITLIGALILGPSQIYADDVSISLNEEFLFNVENLKPGDYMIRDLVVENDSDYDYYFHAEAEFTGGSEKLYNQFHLTVTDSTDEVIYEGSLDGFNGMESRFLEVDASEEFKFKATFPYESDNSFQGLSTQFNIKVWAEAEPPEDNQEGVVDSDTDVKGGGFLPQTGEEIPYLFYIIGGTFLISGLALYLVTRRLASDKK